jgi:hypothetical protein
MAWIAAAAAVGGSLISGYGANKAAKKGAASADRAAELAYKQSLPWDVKGMFGGAKFDEEGRSAEISLSPEMQTLYDKYTGRSSKISDRVAAMGDDPEAMQRRFYEEQKAIYAPQDEKDIQALESRLLAQGMLGSTGGQGRMKTLRSAMFDRDLKARFAAFDKVQALQNAERARESEDLTRALGIGALPGDYANLGRGVGQGMTGAAQSGAKLRSEGAWNRADTSAAGWGSFGKSIGEANWGSIFGSGGGGGSLTSNSSGGINNWNGQQYGSYGGIGVENPNY